jgi:hypothetical protein
MTKVSTGRLYANTPDAANKQISLPPATAGVYVPPDGGGDCTSSGKKSPET